MAKQVYDLDSDKMITVEDKIPDAADKDQAAKKDAEKEEESEEEEEDEENEEESGDEEKKSEEESEEEEEEESDDDEKEKSSKKEETPSVDDFIKEQFKEEFDIENLEQFKEVLDKSVEVLNENETLKAELKELKEKPAAPAFKSKSQESVYNALKDYDPERIPDGLHMIAGLVGMDLDKTDPKLILEQQFIMEHPELGLEKARKKFQRRFDEKFTVKEDEFQGTAEALKEKKEDLDSDLEIEVAKAKKFIKEKQQEFKVKSEDKKEVLEVAEPIQKGIASNATEFDKHMDGLTKLTFQPDENDSKNLFHYIFSKEELDQIKTVVKVHLKNPKDYDAKGNLIGGFDPEEKFQVAAFMIAGQKITEQALKFAKNYAQVIKAEEIGSKKPSRKAKSSGDVKSMDIDAQAERLAEKKRVQRQNQGA